MFIDQLAASQEITKEEARALIATASRRYRPIPIGPASYIRRRRVYAPHLELKWAQHWVLAEILPRLPVHESATAYSRGSSPSKNAGVHRDSRFMLRMDFARFFESILDNDLRRHLDEFSSILPQPWTAADTADLVGIVCRCRRLPIGAPTSPMLANSVCLELDRQLLEVATELGVRYTRYSDDLCFSTIHPNRLSRMESLVRFIVRRLDCPGGLHINEHKTRHTSLRTRRRVTGLILTPEGKVSIGRRRKREIRSLIHRYAELDADGRVRLAGLLAWAHDAEPEFEQRLARKFGTSRMAAARVASSGLETKETQSPMDDAPEKRSVPQDGPRPPWMEKVSKLLARRRPTEALRVLERVIEDEVPLLWGLPAIEHSRRVAWLFGIRLLREMNRPSAALAWTCLECEINPENASAQVLKAELKAELQLGSGAAQRSLRRTEVHWPGVAGMGPLKAVLERDVIRPLRDPALHQKYGLRPPNGIVLYGPPGCGKTHLARSLGTVLGYGFREVKPSDLASIYVHGSQQLIADAFKKAEENPPTVLFFDELDALIPSRAEQGLHHGYRESVNEFLVQMNKCGARGILVVGATNRLEQIDPAALRSGRLEHHFYLGPPDFEGREAGTRQHMKDRVQEPEIDWLNVAAVSEGLSFADIELAVNQAARRAMEEGKPIGTRHLLAAMEGLRVRGNES